MAKSNIREGKVCLHKAFSVRACLDSFQTSAQRPVDGSSLAVFRIVFGMAMTVYAVKAIVFGEVRGIFVAPVHHFSYWGFSWLRPWPGNGMYLHFVALAVSGLLVSAGVAYRLSSVAMALLFSFVFLCERTAYLNHYYLMLLICWMLVWLPADRALSIDKLGRQDTVLVPAWNVWFAQFHVGLPYFFGGVAKVSADWLQGQPMRMTLASLGVTEKVAGMMPPEAVVQLFSIGGMLFDLTIVPALLWRRTRKTAFVLVLLFHLINASVFPIGVFPWLMIAATAVFFEPDWPRRFLPGSRKNAPAEPTAQTQQQRIIVSLACCYAVVHCVLPVRHFLNAGDPNWTERGHFFSWHMMLRGKRCGLRMYVTDTETGKAQSVDLRGLVTPYQFPKVGRDPEHIRQLAHLIADSVEKKTGQRMAVHAFALVSLNGRQAELLVDPTVDLASEPASWSFPAWINELRGPLLKEHWDVPLLEWENELGLDADAIVRAGRPEELNRCGNQSTAKAISSRFDELTQEQNRM